MLLKLLASFAQKTGAFRNVQEKRKKKKRKKGGEIYANCRKFQKVHKTSIPLLLSNTGFSLCPPTYIS